MYLVNRSSFNRTRKVLLQYIQISSSKSSASNISICPYCNQSRRIRFNNGVLSWRHRRYSSSNVQLNEEVVSPIKKRRRNSKKFVEVIQVEKTSGSSVKELRVKQSSAISILKKLGIKPLDHSVLKQPNKTEKNLLETTVFNAKQTNACSSEENTSNMVSSSEPTSSQQSVYDVIKILDTTVHLLESRGLSFQKNNLEPTNNQRIFFRSHSFESIQIGDRFLECLSKINCYPQTLQIPRELTDSKLQRLGDSEKKKASLRTKLKKLDEKMLSVFGSEDLQSVLDEMGLEELQTMASGDGLARPLLEELDESLRQNIKELESLEQLLKEQPKAETTPKKTKKKHTKKDKEKELSDKLKALTVSSRTRTLNFSLISYLDACISNNMFNRAHYSLLYYHRLIRKISHQPLTSLKAFNIMIDAWARKAEWIKTQELLRIMERDGLKLNYQTYAALFQCAIKIKPVDISKLHHIADLMKTQGLNIESLFKECEFVNDQREEVLEAIQLIDPNFKVSTLFQEQPYEFNVLKPLNSLEQKIVSCPSGSLFSSNDLNELAEKQFKAEIDGRMKIKSIEKKPSTTKKMELTKKKLEAVQTQWRKTMMESFQKKVKSLREEGGYTMNIHPYLTVLKPDVYIDAMLQEIVALSQLSENYSPAMNVMYQNLGKKIMHIYLIQDKQRSGIVDKTKKFYEKYCEYYTDPELYSRYIPRVYWEKLCSDYPEGPTIDVPVKTWPYHVLVGVGQFLYDIIMNDIKIDVNIFKEKAPMYVPAFYHIYRSHDKYKLKGELKPHPVILKLNKLVNEDLVFETSLLPMISPPMPWTSVNTGGFLVFPADFIRLTYDGGDQKQSLMETDVKNFHAAFDSLNMLGVVPWIVNKPILDLMIDLFNKGGNEELEIPPPITSCPPVPKITSSMPKSEKFKILKERMNLRRKREDMYSLWCNALYKLSIANHFRDQVVWFPNNLDFRGRVYPCPPHFNHLGSDMSRGLLLFAEGKPLGEKGLEWLKIHLINLTGMKKREPVSERLRYCDEMLPEIFDSADKPLEGNGWWKKSDEPWQTLACCMELAKALRSPDPTKYICHFPVHQDGSCNGLQHYAALGRDQFGAEEVNLSPSVSPKDVYSAVAALVERERKKDAANNVEIAKILEGFVSRKVIKQTVMTTVYGVTRFGAHLQILRQLRDIPEFPERYAWPASFYLVQKTFYSLQEMFTATKEIQKWFTESARLISKSLSKPVEWMTPLGLPVIQPYYCHYKSKLKNMGKEMNKSHSALSQILQPNIIKQRNGFPPNYIHSLDSSHMMLTSLYAQKEGITFAAVHDCYWTHPNTVDVMNKICREQFVALHKEPLLEDLSDYFIQKYGLDDETLKVAELDSEKRKLIQLLKSIPYKGSFDLDSVLQSVYFFS